MQQPIISVSGLRGVLGLSLSPEMVSRYVAAYVGQLPEGPILVARDSRPSGLPLAEVIRGTLILQGRDVCDVGIMATPTVGVMIRELKCVGGIQISASHNPPQYNGVKLMGGDGRVIGATQGSLVLESFQTQRISWAPHDELGETIERPDLIGPHLDKVLETVGVAAIAKRKFKVLLDCNGGAGSPLGLALLEKLGCQVTVVGETPDGNFLHPPEPIAENLTDICAQVKAAKVDVGFCQDPDADRLAVIDENGRYLGEEYTVALCLDNVLKQSPGPVVINCATSRMNEDIAAKFKCPVTRSAVGEANVTEQMVRNGAVFGGEGSGGPIDPRVGYVRDSFVGMANVLDLMTRRKKKISALADALPRYEIVKQKIDFEVDSLENLQPHFESIFPEAEIQTSDGLRLAWPDRWLLIRGSNTEPIIRIIAESTTEKQSLQMCEEAGRALRGN